MQLTTNLLAALAPALALAGNAAVYNACSFPVTLWSVGSSVGPATTLAANGGKYSEPFFRDPVTGGKALKVTADPDGLWTGKPQVIFSYSFTDPTIWYDLSTVFGPALGGSKIVISSADKNCEAIVWPQGTEPAGDHTVACGAASDVTMTLCAA